MPSWLATTWEKQSSNRNLGLWMFSVISPILYPRSAQPKDIAKVSSFNSSHMCYFRNV
jgi:hypothetical protein